MYTELDKLKHCTFSRVLTGEFDEMMQWSSCKVLYTQIITPKILIALDWINLVWITDITTRFVQNLYNDIGI